MSPTDSKPDQPSAANYKNTRVRSGQNPRSILWVSLFCLATFTIYFSVFMEWLFFITKPSFMDPLPVLEKVGIYLLASLLITAGVLLLLGVLWLISLLPFVRRYWKIFLYAGGVIPGVFLAVTFLILIDNFTYTVFHLSTLTSEGAWRGVYGAIFVLIAAGCSAWVIRHLSRNTRRRRLEAAIKTQGLVGVGILALSVLLGLTAFHEAAASQSIPVTGTAKNRPNILLIGSDGLDADHMSVYNAKTNTTPFLQTFSQQTLLAENNFPNANETAGSLVSLFTGRLPTATRTLYPPDILKGNDAFKHLPEILKSQGYYNAEISVDYYADMTNLNMQESFVTVNGRSTTLGSLYTLSRRIIPEDAAYFLSTVAKGATDRLAQIFYIYTVSNPYSEVTLPLETTTDQDRVNELMNLFRTIHQPLFVHVHMMGTHLDKWDTYDQAITGFDGYMKEVIADLTQMGKLENTVIIVYTDHGFTDVTNMRIPLMIRFPHEQYTGQITHNTQNLDIAPTVLDYLGITPPRWMTGQSLIAGEPDALRPIFSAAPNYRTGNTKNELQLDESKIKPPFYQFGTIGVLVCQKWFALDTSQLSWTEGIVEDYPTPCDENSLPTDSQAHQLVYAQLARDGFDLSGVDLNLQGSLPGLTLVGLPGTAGR